MSEPIILRDATARDVGELTRLYQQLESAPGSEPVSEERVARTFSQTRRFPGYRVLVALESGRIVGSFVLVIFETLGARCAPEAVVEDVVVDREVRGKGIGRCMMAFAMDAAAAAGCYKLVLSSNEARAGAHAFYESLGFRRHGFSFRVDLEMDGSDR